MYKTQKKEIKLIKELFNFVVPFNHKSILRENKKSGKVFGWLSLFCSLVFIFISVLAVLSETTPLWSLLIFAGFVVGTSIAAFHFFNQGKYNPKHDKLVYKYVFLEDGLVISKNSNKNLEDYKVEAGCLYRPYKNKQYIAKVVEDDEDLTFRILVGTTNFVPNYKQYILPKDLINEVEHKDFIPTLKEIFGKDYTVKTKS